VDRARFAKCGNVAFPRGYAERPGHPRWLNAVSRTHRQMVYSNDDAIRLLPQPKYGTWTAPAIRHHPYGFGTLGYATPLRRLAGHRTTPGLPHTGDHRATTAFNTRCKELGAVTLTRADLYLRKPLASEAFFHSFSRRITELGLAMPIILGQRQIGRGSKEQR